MKINQLILCLNLILTISNIVVIHSNYLYHLNRSAPNALFAKVISPQFMILIRESDKLCRTSFLVTMITLERLRKRE